MADDIDHILRVDALHIAALCSGEVCPFDRRSQGWMGWGVRRGYLRRIDPWHYRLTDKGRAFVAAREARYG